MHTTSRDTIYALSSGRLPAGVAVIRVSGPGTRLALQSLAGGVPPARRAVLRVLRSADGGEVDQALVIYFPAPASFTGEDCAEFQVHGGRAIVSALLAQLGLFDGFRAAEAGEFTLRAFLHGKVDLTGAEALADLIAAETEAQRRFALGNSHGRQKDLYQDWRRRLLHIRAMVEAELDFADEGDVPGSVGTESLREVSLLRQDILSHVATFDRAELIRDGAKVVIVGAPNAGKSSLLNALAQRDVAIVSDEPGTTRDLLEVVLDLNGFRVQLTDTAGIRADPGKIEAMGIERALSRLSEADLVLELQDMSFPGVEITHANPSVLRVGTKRDLISREACPGGFDHVISVVTGEGVEGLVSDISDRVAQMAGNVEDTLPSRARHKNLLTLCARHLEAISGAQQLELLAEDLRLASDALGRITGAVDVEDLLDAIFSEFCVGK